MVSRSLWRLLIIFTSVAAGNVVTPGSSTLPRREYSMATSKLVAVRIIFPSCASTRTFFKMGRFACSVVTPITARSASFRWLLITTNFILLLLLFKRWVLWVTYKTLILHRFFIYVLFGRNLLTCGQPPH